MPGPAVAPPRAGDRGPRARLSSLNNRSSLPQYKAKASTPSQPAPQVRDPKIQCCEAPVASVSDSEILCYNCGRQWSSSNIVADVTFNESGAGPPTVQGSFVADNQRFAGTMGGTMHGLGGMQSRQQSEMNGRVEIQKLSAALNIRQAVQDQANLWYKLALNHAFVQGRRIRNVAAVAIYCAARRQPENTLMLMDLAEKVQVNVWTLGDTYKSFLKTLMETDPGQVAGNRTVQEIEPLMLKFCRKLEFDEDSHKVAADACKLLKRMKRDWMVQGRQPAGLCGACIILAARMNNFRRTVREVVYVVKVADSTINQRLYEFKRTPSSALTVKQFRDFGQQLKVRTLPPAIWKRAEKEERKRKATEDAGDTVDPVEVQAEDGSDQAGTNTSTARSANANKRRKAANGKARKASALANSDETASDRDRGQNGHQPIDVDALTNADAGVDSLAAAQGSDDADEEEVVMPKKRGRPPKKRTPIVVPQEDLEIEREIESEINETIRDWEDTFKAFESNEGHEVFVRARNAAQQLTQQHMPNKNVSMDPEVMEGEFEDDEDVRTCLNLPHEVINKERMWLTENEDWLREKQAKIHAQELEKALGIEKKPKQRRKHNRMGDGSVLGGEPASSAADAAHKMLQKRAKYFSSHINYDKLKELFPGGDGGSTGASPQDSTQGRSPTGLEGPPQNAQSNPQTAGHEDVDAEGDDEEEEEERYPQEEEEEDLEHQYSDEEEEEIGYANNDDLDPY